MALRNFASSALSTLGLKPQLLAFQGVGPIAARAYATVIDGYKYAKSHEWAKVDGDVATVGISDHAQAELGDVVYVELPEVGKQVKQGETFGVVESVKAASDVYSPVSGEVVEVNQVLADSPATVNKDCYKSGWIIKVKMSSKGDLTKLMDAATYKKESEH
uniref:Glycine cleavage system H protein n=1 Tax=Chlamydomonas leiostraca TaxID=1034604 RepID=A0A7S0RDN0_9CHLO|mmetsp:Transcript_20242/g.51234  ORF Transcript_20242/g.51234 Transcript_20242/m.51234 type:complete len:161 (+) Transcript_20242:22-504(+)|eukprot:CAMPEP_0202865430 /NCGR_PEP_ID=MMETSP1391-20130828/5988_1 /ASSEMBLY_ACC=CAM_ASM_000867 /TAXON_ID=1034604 /ORGANISM="Chlamydomonas leiostraca, Strain SAG 11-49" /LENGTH=160 /DNA_ID=CAMNT_0049545275 /DNA_START=19 /DNA_END=501 /DNA_ORIENTATION=+